MNKHAKQDGDFFQRALDMCLVSPSCVLFTRAYWEEMGPFDESLPACEDYDLWLRTLLRHEVGLYPEPLVVKTGGHADQLSRKIIGLDLYRIQALLKLLREPGLHGRRRRLAEDALDRKAGYYVRGCLKRGKPGEAERVREMVRAGLDQSRTDGNLR